MRQTPRLGSWSAQLLASGRRAHRSSETVEAQVFVTGDVILFERAAIAEASRVN